jgi:hypothetical protein
MPEGRKAGMKEFERALRNGTLVRGNGANIPPTDPKVLEELLAKAKERATQAISLRVSIADIEMARALAEKQGVGYQTVLKQAIHEGLKRKRTA